MDVPRTERADQNHGAESRGDDEQSIGTHGGQGQDTASSQEKEVPEREETTEVTLRTVQQ